jgi:hypothetical protein
MVDYSYIDYYKGKLQGDNEFLSPGGTLYYGTLNNKKYYIKKYGIIKYFEDFYIVEDVDTFMLYDGKMIILKSETYHEKCDEKITHYIFSDKKTNTIYEIGTDEDVDFLIKNNRGYFKDWNNKYNS